MFSVVLLFRLFIYVNNTHNLVGGSATCLLNLLCALFASDNKEIYFTIPQPSLIFVTLLYQPDYPTAHRFIINFNNCLS
jgi:hypothetical protein